MHKTEIFAKIEELIKSLPLNNSGAYRTADACKALTEFLGGNSQLAEQYMAARYRFRNLDRNENEERLRAILASVPLPDIDYARLECLIQRELDMIGVNEFRLDCELAEVAIKILYKIGAKNVFLGNIDPVCALAYRYGAILRAKHDWAAGSNELDFHDALSAIVFQCVSKAEAHARLLAGALLEELEPESRHWRGYGDKLAAVAGATSEAMITTARAEVSAALAQLKSEGCCIDEGEPSYERIPKVGPHLEGTPAI